MYSPANKNNWVGRVDENEGEAGYRWHQIIRCIDLESQDLPLSNEGENSIVIIGFCCDEGVRRNKGRIGAKDGPESFRKACSNLANHFQEKSLVYDVGDIICNDHDLESAQGELQKLVSSIHSKGYFVFVIGGGHEVALPHFMGIRNIIPKNKSLGIFNMDAHFDLRIPNNTPSSGTPFYQVAKLCKTEKHEFKYLVAGIQKSANTRALFNRADQLGVSYIQASDFSDRNSELKSQKIDNFIRKVDFIYFTICLDVFDISVAPGVSAPSAIGIQPDIALEMITKLMQSGKLISADIAELNPSLDQDGKTSRLASKLAFEILTNYQESNL